MEVGIVIPTEKGGTKRWHFHAAVKQGGGILPLLGQERLLLILTRVSSEKPAVDCESAALQGIGGGEVHACVCVCVCVCAVSTHTSVYNLTVPRALEILEHFSSTGQIH